MGTLRAIRLLHHYSGVFFAPAILFFAITGGLQMFGLHESSRGSTYVPPVLLVHLAQLHKKGTIFLPQRRPEPPAVAKAKDSVQREAPKVPVEGPSGAVHNSLPMKVFFGLTALGLVVSTCTGLWMAWKYTRSRAKVAAVFFAGVVIPVLLLVV